MRENDPTLPISPYGATKLAAERYTTVYATLFGLRAAILRRLSVDGPRLRKPVIYDLMRKVRNKPVELLIEEDRGRRPSGEGLPCCRQCRNRVLRRDRKWAAGGGSCHPEHHALKIAGLRNGQNLRVV